MPGNDEKHFNAPSDVLVAPNGDIFVADGHGGDTNARIVKFDKNGKFIKTWGHKGTGPGEFDAPHGLALDSQGRLFVADRSNSRIQIFDLNGRYLDQWRDIRSPYYLAMTRDQQMVVSDGVTQKILKYDLEGRLLNGWGTFGPFPGGLWGVHQVSVDGEGNLYVAEVFNGRVQKFRPRPGVDRSQLVGQTMQSLSR